MAGYTNRAWLLEISGEEGDTIEIPVNRWGPVNYTLMITSFGDTSIDVAGTIDQLNRVDANGDPISPNYFPLKDIDGATLTAVASLGLFIIAPYPLEAIKITNNGSVQQAGGRLMQQGSVN